MQINLNYAERIEKAKLSGASYVNFDEKVQQIAPIKSNSDTFTLSSEALALMKGESPQQTSPTYVRPVTANELLNSSQATELTTNTNNASKEKSASDLRFDNLMQSILDKRLGIDRERLEEIEAMMEAVAKNENLSPEEKEKALEQLAEIREQIIEESIETRETAKHSFSQNEELS